LLLAEIDFLSRQRNGTGLRPILRALYAQKRREQITTEFFKQFLETHSGLDLTAMFDRFVYNKPGPEFMSLEALAKGRDMTIEAIRELEAKTPHVLPHRPYTQEELDSLR
jgi:predicted metalloprotease with PDZ domain